MNPAPAGYRKVLILVSGAAFLDFLDVTVVNLAFPSIQRDFPSATVSSLTWVITGYAILFAALLTAAGRLADVLGRKRVFLLGVALFTLASLASALAPSLAALIVARFVQGAGAALILPSGLGIVLNAAPPERRAAAIGIWGASAGAAAAFGPTVAGILVHLSDWRAVFLINVPLGAAIVFFGRRLITEARIEGERLPDIVGTVLVAAGIGLVVLGVTKASDWGWSSRSTVASLAGGLVLVALALARSRRHPAPAVEIGLWRIRQFAISNGCSVFFGAAVYAAMLISVLFLVQVWHYSVLKAGFAMSPGAVTGGIAAAITGRLVDKRGQRPAVIAGGSLMVAITLYVAAALTATPHYLAIWLPGNTLNGVAMGIGAVGLSSAAATVIPPERFAAATGLNMTARQVGGALGVAVLAAILEAQVRQGVSAYTHVYLFCAFAAIATVAIGTALSAREAAPAKTARRTASEPAQASW